RDTSGNPVEIFFVTGRREDPSERSATEWNLYKEGYETWSRLYLRPDFTRGDDVATYKGFARKDIEKTHKIVANLGDQYSDLIGEPGDDHAEKCFKLPNPFYYIPPGLPEAGLKCLQRRARPVGTAPEDTRSALIPMSPRVLRQAQDDGEGVS